MKKILLLLIAITLLTAAPALAENVLLSTGQPVKVNNHNVIYSGVLHQNSFIYVLHVQYGKQFIPLYLKGNATFKIGSKEFSIGGGNMDFMRVVSTN